MVDTYRGKLTFSFSGGQYTAYFNTIKLVKPNIDIDVKQTPNPGANNAMVISVGRSVETLQIEGYMKTGDYDGLGITPVQQQVFTLISNLHKYRGTEDDGLMSLELQFPDVTRTFQGVVGKITFDMGEGMTDETYYQLGFKVGVLPP